jgi:hypothetical protein
MAGVSAPAPALAAGGAHPIPLPASASLYFEPDRVSLPRSPSRRKRSGGRSAQAGGERFKMFRNQVVSSHGGTSRLAARIEAQEV